MCVLGRLVVLFWDVGPIILSVPGAVAPMRTAGTAPHLLVCPAPVSPVPGSQPSRGFVHGGRDREHGHGEDKQQKHLGTPSMANTVLSLGMLAQPTPGPRSPRSQRAENKPILIEESNMSRLTASRHRSSSPGHTPTAETHMTYFSFKKERKKKPFCNAYSHFLHEETSDFKISSL